MSEALTTCGICGCDYMVKNPHPDAGKPERYEEVGATYVCVPCSVLARHVWSKRALRAEAAVRRWVKAFREYHSMMMPVCVKCGGEKVVRPPNGIPDCPQCDNISEEEANKILGIDKHEDPTDNGG